MPGCGRGDSDQLSNLRTKRSNTDFILGMEQSTKLFTLARLHGSLLIRYTCVIWAWRTLTTVSLGVSCGSHSGSIGDRGHYSEPSGHYITRVRVVLIFSAESQTSFQLVLVSAIIVPFYKDKISRCSEGEECVHFGIPIITSLHLQMFFLLHQTMTSSMHWDRLQV